MEPAWHLFVIRSTQRTALQAHMKASGVETLIHYPIAPHLQPAYRALGLPAGTFPLAERLQEEVLSLPIGPHLRLQDIAHVSSVLRQGRHLV